MASIIEVGAQRVVAAARISAADAKITAEQERAAMTAVILAGLTVVLQQTPASSRESLLRLCRGWLADEGAEQRRL